ncbi:hypothetical protein BDV97DRAFT_375608 [Delphinella strobiligena]|nr:hypothetical protein BDV97DRAFT_375608 [Delphinella strobiligena]
MRVLSATIVLNLFWLTSAQLSPPSNLAPQVIMSDSEIGLSDVMGKDRSINIFAGFTRDIQTVSVRLDSNLANTTVLAPRNSDITKLPRKPWEDPNDYSELGQSAYEGQSGEDRARRNLRRFVEAHIVPESPWKEGHKLQTLEGHTIWWETKDGRKLIQPGSIEVLSVPSTVANGELWILNGVINYA